MPKHDQHVALRLNADTIARIDALLPALSEPWHTATRSDALRKLLLAALDRAEKDPELLRRHDRAVGDGE